MVFTYDTSTFFFSFSGMFQNFSLSGIGKLSMSLITGAIPVLNKIPPLSLETTPGINLGFLFSTNAVNASSPSL